MTTPEPLLARARALQLHGVVSHWAECAQAPWIAPLIEWEETERARRSLERRLRCAHIGRFKPLADFDWRWPEQCDQAAIAELMTLGFLETATNALLVGPSGLFIGTMVYTQQGAVGNMPLAAAFTLVPLLIIALYLWFAKRLGAFHAL